MSNNQMDNEKWFDQFDVAQPQEQEFNDANEKWFDQFDNNIQQPQNEQVVNTPAQPVKTQTTDNEAWFDQFNDNQSQQPVSQTQNPIVQQEPKPFELSAKRNDLWQSAKSGITKFGRNTKKNAANLGAKYMNYMGDRPTNNILANGAKDVGEIVGGMAQLVGGGINTGIVEPIRRIINPDESLVTDNGINFVKSLGNDVSSLGKVFQKTNNGKNAYRVQLRQNHPELSALKDGLVQSVKEQYGQTGDLSKGEFDLGGLGESFLKHPVLNVMDVIGLGEIGKIKTISKATNSMRKARLARKELVDEALFNSEVKSAIKEIQELKGGTKLTPEEVQEVIKNIRKDKVIAKNGKEYKVNDQNQLIELPKSSDNLVIGAVDDLLKTDTARKVINTVTDNKVGEAIGDFLGSKSNSSLLGAKNTSKRQLKELQKKQKDDLRQSIYDSQQENNELFGKLSDDEGKELFQSAEKGLEDNKTIPEAGGKTSPAGTGVVPDGQKAINEFLTEKPSAKSADELELGKINNEINSSTTKIIPKELIRRKNELEQKIAATQNNHTFDIQKYNNKLEEHKQNGYNFSEGFDEENKSNAIFVHDKDGNRMATVDYFVEDNKVYIDEVTNNSYKTNYYQSGQADKAIDALIAKFPDKEIVWEAVTKEGRAFKKKYLEENPEMKSKVSGVSTREELDSQMNKDYNSLKGDSGNERNNVLQEQTGDVYDVRTSNSSNDRRGNEKSLSGEKTDGTVANGEIRSDSKTYERGQNSKTDAERVNLSLRDKLKEKIDVNSEYYRSKGMLTEETQKRTVFETYLAHKHNLHTVDEVRKFCANPKNFTAKRQALKEIMKMPDSKKPFYVPRMYKERLTAADFKIFGNKKYLDDIDNLKKRSYTGNTDVIDGGKYNRSYNIEKVVNRLDEQRIKLQNMETFIDDVTKGFAKPLSNGMKVDKGYVAFNPEAIKKVFFGKIDLSELMIDGLKAGENIEVSLKNALQTCGADLSEEIRGAIKSLQEGREGMMQIPEYIYKDLVKSVSGSKKSAGGTIFDIGTDAFKKNVLGLNAKWVINNRIGNTIMAALKGTNLLNPANVRRISKLADDLFPTELTGETFHNAEQVSKMKKTGVKYIDNVLSLADGESVVDSKILSAFSVPGKIVNKVSKAVFDFNQKFEKMDRQTVYLKELDKERKAILKDTGKKMMSDVEMLKYAKNNKELKAKILERVDDVLGDYSTMTPFEKDVLKKIMPFYSWYRTISRHTMTLPKTNPIRASIISKLSAYADDETNERPFFQKHAVKTSGRSKLDNKELLLNYEHSIPYSTFQESADNPISGLHPMVNNFVDAVSGVNTYNGMPLQSKGYEKVYGGGTTDLNDKQAKVINLPAKEKYKAFLINSLRDMIPGVKQTERVIGGSISNSIKDGKLEFKPYDKLWDTDFGGYMEGEVRPDKKGWAVDEQLLRYFLPLQKEYEITKNPYGYRRKQQKHNK